MNTLSKKEQLKKSIMLNNQKLAQSSCYSNLVVSSSYGKQSQSGGVDANQSKKSAGKNSGGTGGKSGGKGSGKSGNT